MKNKNAKIILISILGTLLGLSTISFAYLRITKKQTNQNELSVLKCLDIEMQNEQDDILIDNAFAISDEDGKHTKPYKFSIKNNCDLTLRINVNLENLVVTKRLEDNYIKVYLEAGSYSTLNKLSSYETKTATLENGVSSRRLLNHKLPADTQMEYELRIWIDEETTWEEGKDKSYLGKIVINAEPEYEDGKSSIVLDLNGGESNQVLNELYYEGDKITLDEPTKSGYLFIGWEVVSGDAEINENVITIKKQSSTIKAKWARIVELAVDLNGGTTSQIFNSTYRNDEMLELLSPTKSGATFAGWEIVSGDGKILTNLVNNGSFESGVNLWDTSSDNIISLDASRKVFGNYSNKYMTTTTELIDLLQCGKTLIKDHIYYAMEYIYLPEKNNTAAAQFDLVRHYGTIDGYPEYGDINLNADTDWQKLSFIFTSEITHDDYCVRPIFSFEILEANIDGVLLIDLTNSYGSQNEPNKIYLDNNIDFFNDYSLVFNMENVSIKAIWE